MSKEVHRIYFCKDGAILDTQIREGEDVTDTLKRCFKKISDLETKLAEKEDQINWLVEAEFNRKWAKKYVEMRRKEDPMLCLPDSDEVYEKYFELKQQLAEKDNEITQRLVIQERDYNQDKISFAVAELNKLWDCLYKTDDKGYVIRFASMNDRDKFNAVFDNQIKQLKEGK